FRPKELWPKRVLRFTDAARQARATLRLLEDRGYVEKIAASHEDDRDNLIAAAAQSALERFDEILRELASQRYQEFERELRPLLTRFAVEETVRRFHHLHWPESIDGARWTEETAGTLAPEYGPWLAKTPALEDVSRLSQAVARRLHDLGAIGDPTSSLMLKQGF